MAALSGDALITIGREGDHVAILTLNRVDKRNAINVAMRWAMGRAIDLIAADVRVRVMVLAAAGPVFSAGTDLKEAATIGEEERSVAWQALWSALDRIGIPVIAAVSGAAYGAGFELALAADMVVASRDSRFALPEVRHGFIPGGGGTQRLVRQIGKHRAMRMILAADSLSAEEAFALGLVSGVVEQGRSFEAAMQLAHNIAAMPAEAVREAKALLKAGPNLSLSAALALEQSALRRLNGSSVQRERLASFALKEGKRSE